jgi:phage/plasmid-like protein (TIGR03299 family)
MPAEIESGYFARATPWHRIGVVTEDAKTAAEAIKIGHLDWIVEKEQVYVKRNNTLVEVPDRFALTRNTDHRVMSIVSDVYKPFQNVQAFDFMDALVEDKDATYETALSLRHGAVVALSMHVPMDILIAGEDKHEAYLLLRTTHDGSGRVSVYVVMVRVVCMNTLTMAIRGASHFVGFTHTADVAAKVQEARISLGMTYKYSEEFKKTADKLVSVKVSDDDIIAFLESQMPVRTHRDAEIEAVMENIQTSDNLQNFKGTAWAGLNGIAEYFEHVKPNRSGEAIFSRVIDGSGAKMRNAFTNRFLVGV